MKKSSCLIFCNCGAGLIPESKQQLLTGALQQLNIDVFELHDICSFSLNEKEYLNALDTYTQKFILACYPRAIKNMFQQNNISISNFEVINFREHSAEEIIETIRAKMSSDSVSGGYIVKKSALDVPAWYPVIDKSRCTLCGQCARFCVFGVYKFNKKNLDVVNPLSCKNNCPACGRTCPTSAIIFPRLPENSVLSGDEPGEEQQPAKNPQKDGLFVLLNERNKSRRNIFRQDVMQLAEEEKKKAIEELKKGLKN